MLKYKDNNPKTIAGAARLPLHLVPPSAVSALAEAMADGARKYGPYNWRESPISVSPYIAAAMRHLHAFWDGEDNARDSGVSHLAHAMATLAVLTDAFSVGVAIDDRPPKGKAADIQAAYANKNKEVVKDAATEQQRGSDPVQPIIDRINRWTDAVVNGRVPHDEADVRPEAGRE
jgi:hypothetical protein